MAEARSIHTLGGELKRGVQLSLNEDGVAVNLAFVLPTPRKAVRLALARLERLRRAVVGSLFPYGVPVFFAVVGLVVTVVLGSSSESWWRSGWLADLAWSVSLWFPWFEVPHGIRVGVVAFWAGFICFLLLASLQRFLLSLLLSWHGYMAEGRNPTLKLKVWAVLVRALSSLGGNRTTYSFQRALPALPLPPVESTVHKYLEYARAQQTDEEFKATEALAHSFLRNEGPTLQKYLRFKWWVSSNYVSDWWEKYVYLRGRSSIMVNSNYYILDSARRCPTHVRESRAAALVYNFLRFQDDLENERIEPIMIGHGLVPLCMDQYRRIFSTTRIPGRECDEIVHYAADESKHVVVLCRGRYYRLPVFRSNGALLNPLELEEQFNAIKKHAEEAPAVEEHEAAIAALTAENRTRWAEAREMHFSDSVNRVSLHAIESALFFVHLDDEEYAMEDWTGRGHSLIHGNGTNRWFDKSITMVVYANGKMGLNAEHAWADAPVVAHVLEVAMLVGENRLNPYDPRSGKIRADILDTIAGPFSHGNPFSGGASRPSDPCERSTLLPWEPLTWKLTRQAERVIDEALVNARAIIDDLDLHVVSHREYGKSFMKRCGVSPDAYVQMAMQLAYFRDAGRFAATYESSMTRIFLQGRTETIRPATVDSCAFVRAMEDKAVSPAEKLAALRRAAQVHVRHSHEAMAGEGIDRHLFALYVVSVGKAIDSPFIKAALNVPWRLSTSQQPQQQTKLWDLKNPDDATWISPGGGFGPVADDGYGVSYMVSGEDEMFFHVSSKRASPATNSERFIRNLFQALKEMKEVLSLALDEKKKKDDAAAAAKAVTPGAGAAGGGGGGGGAASKKDE